MNRIPPYRDWLSRGAILTLGLLLLLAVNGFFLVIVKYQSYTLIYVLFLCLLGWFYWKKWRIYSTLSYLVDDARIEIRLHGKVIRSIEKNTITSLETDQSLDSYRRGVFSTFEAYHARLSATGLTKITLDQGEVIWLSGEVN